MNLLCNLKYAWTFVKSFNLHSGFNDIPRIGRQPIDYSSTSTKAHNTYKTQLISISIWFHWIKLVLHCFIKSKVICISKNFSHKSSWNSFIKSSNPMTFIDIRYHLSWVNVFLTRFSLNLASYSDMLHRSWSEHLHEASCRTRNQVLMQLQFKWVGLLILLILLNKESLYISISQKLQRDHKDNPSQWRSSSFIKCRKPFILINTLRDLHRRHLQSRLLHSHFHNIKRLPRKRLCNRPTRPSNNLLNRWR